MSKSVTQNMGNSKRDTMKWVLVSLIVIAGIVANLYFANVAWALRAAAGIVVIAIVVAVAFQTAAGKSGWEFLKASKVELRKVVWPTRQETIQTTVIVVIMVVITAIILWGLDTLFLWFVGWLTGQRG